MRRWRGLKTLLHDAVDATTELVREGQDATGRLVVRAASLVPPLEAPARLAEGARQLGTGTTLASIRAVNRAVEALTDLALDTATGVGLVPSPRDEQPVPLRSDVVGTPAWIADAAIGMVNGAIGDQLAARRNGLDLGLRLRLTERFHDTGPVTLDEAGPRIVVLVHGLSTTEWSWCLDAAAQLGDATATYGTLLRAQHGHVPVYARYNSGRPVAESASALTAALDRLVHDWPVPIEEIALVGHSMGGLVVRAACWQARERDASWLRHVRRVVSLGTPHQGAPLARFGQQAADALGAVDLPGTRVLARVIDARSAGIKDLQHGAVEQAGFGRDPDATATPEARVVPLLDDVQYAFLSATLTQDPEHPVGRLLGDLLVRVPSASGPALDTRTFPIAQGTFGGVAHHQIQCHPAVYAELARLLG